MALLARLNDFTPSTVIVSQQVDDEFNQLLNILKGSSTTKDPLIKFNDATNRVLRVDQVGAGAIQQWLQNGTEKVSIRNNGALRINSTQAAADPLKLAIGCDANNLGSILASLQTSGASDIGMRLAMEGPTSASIPALQVTKFDGAVVQTYAVIRNSGEIRVAAGYPSTMANVPTGTSVTLGGQYQQNVSTVGSVGSSETDLHSYTIAANVLANDGDSIDCNIGGQFAANANNKRVRMYFGGTLILDTSAIAFYNSQWSMFVSVIRISSSAVFCNIIGGGTGSGTNIVFPNNITVTGLSFTGTLILKATGTATSNNDVTATASVVRKFAKGT